MRRRVRKLITLGVSTVLAATSLVTTTYAWFKLNATAKVENFDFEVVSGLGFEVSIDGKHYYGDLNMLQMQKAIVASYNPAIYKILPQDEDGNEKADVLYKYIGSDFKALNDTETENEIKEVFKKIKLLPATTKDGINFTDLYNGAYTTTSGRYLEFGVYFKATSDNKNDNLKYDIYLNGFSGEDERGDTMVNTIFTSKTTSVPLSANMTAVKTNIDDGTKSIVNLKSSDHDKITVYSSNAARISTTSSSLKHYEARYFETTDEDFDASKTYYTYDITSNTYNIYEDDDFVNKDEVKYYEFIDAYDEYVVDEGSSLIYEINDTENPYTDLGSYATNYSKLFPDDTTSNNYYLYNCDCNAMYTYYNNLRSEDRGLKNNELDYNELPQNIIKALPTQMSSKINKASSPGEAGDSSYYPITTVESGATAKLITFRVWLEGWDADCFDGLSNSIDMRLAFCSKRVY